MRAESTPLRLPRLPNLTDQTPEIQVAIVSEAGTTALADSLEILLAEAKGFTSSRFDNHADTNTKLDRGLGFSDPDVLVATLGAFSADTETFVASLRCGFPHCPILVTTTHPDTFD